MSSGSIGWATELSESVGFDVSFEQLMGPRYRYRLGHHGNPDGHGFAVYFAKVCDPRDWTAVLMLSKTNVIDRSCCLSVPVACLTTIPLR